MEQFVQLKLTEYNRLKAIDEASKPNMVLHMLCTDAPPFSSLRETFYTVKKDVAIEKIKEGIILLQADRDTAYLDCAKLSDENRQLALKVRSYEAACNRYRSIWLIKLFYK